ncbi:CPBP family intramembrane glutamic endopeptidase [Gilvibacter sediminis]|uniref:CPBP family intramembrane glutamic endopeptidase n=1 Tax=Gilvibacter sediminis TaxID=379071 RepID=UPI00234FE151|nr:CPBP family intramembrane glutamic endopeptidase [Gilvibacter sediminis]MDC7997948.1 CPBP family intramembrane metalloprotease [Gilvibacter sediminis]
MYIAQAYKSLYQPWRYLLGVVMVFIGTQLGSIPFVVAIFMKQSAEGGSMLELTDETDMLNILDSNSTFFFMLLGFAVGLLALFLWVKYVHKQSITSLTTSRKKIDWGRFWFGFLLIGVTTTVLTIMDYYGNPDDYVLQFDAKLFAILALIAVIFIPLQTSMEEYLFRGYLMQGIGVMSRNRWLPLLITSFIFGMLHYFNPEVDKLGNIVMVYYIGTGLFLGIITLMDEGMELALGFHAGNNLIAALLVTADWTVFKTNSVFLDVSEPAAGFDVLVPVLVIYPIFIAIMAFRYKWKNWSDRLFGKVPPPPERDPIDFL